MKRNMVLRCIAATSIAIVAWTGTLGSDTKAAEVQHSNKARFAAMQSKKIAWKARADAVIQDGIAKIDAENVEFLRVREEQRLAAERQAEQDRIARAKQLAAAKERPRVAAPVRNVGPSVPSGDRCAYANDIVSAGLPSSMIGIAWRESNCTPTAASSTGCLGLFQICWPLHQDLEQGACGRSDRAGMFDPACNIRIAVSLWNHGAGAKHWSL